ncbi:MAG: iron chaperone [Demequina sp.]|uniref:iron chaperone n=1 Tax=Demequina sp. TaxID=2050685 RepID=UPI003A8835A6
MAESGWTDAEKAAMKERADELRSERGGKKKADALADLMAKVAEMPDAERLIAERIHSLVTAAAPDLEPRTWYGMPAWAKDGKVLCFFQPATKFESRYSTFGFQDVAALDDGVMWPASFALTALGPAEEKQITELVTRAVG